MISSRATCGAVFSRSGLQRFDSGTCFPFPKDRLADDGIELVPMGFTMRGRKRQVDQIGHDAFEQL
jgi:hypothetical protein